MSDLNAVLGIDALARERARAVLSERASGHRTSA
jgi:hypothetical protein